jgi:hypothetical protein
MKKVKVHTLSQRLKPKGKRNAIQQHCWKRGHSVEGDKRKLESRKACRKPFQRGHDDNHT